MTNLPAICDCPGETPKGLSRRGFLTALGLGAAAVAAGPALTRAAFAAPGSPPGDTLVVLDLRGGMDGLSLVAPVGDPAYRALRPSLAIPTSTGLTTGDGMFALHPALAPLQPFWANGSFGAVHAVGQPDETRSHFSSQLSLDRSAPETGLLTGWLDRATQALGASGGMQTVTLGSGVADGVAAGPAPVFAASSLKDFTLYQGGDAAFVTALQALHDGSRLPWAGVGRPTLGAISQAKSLVTSQPKPANGAVYPSGDLGTALADVARLIKARAGLRFASVDMGNWDMHQGLGDAGGGWMARQAGELGQALAAFATDLGPANLATTSLLTVSEFGRRAAQNDSGGVDHGHGNAVLFLGGGLAGGRVLGRWPGLAAAHLDGGDLAGTTDYRDLFAELLTRRVGLSSAAVAGVFPGYRPRPANLARP